MELVLELEERVEKSRGFPTAIRLYAPDWALKVIPDWVHYHN